MTFEEAIELLDNVEEAETREFTDKFGRIDEDSLEIENYRLWAKEVHKVISTLQETYAPKIKMPQKIMLVFMEMKFNYQVDFEFFWKLMGDCVATDYLRENYKEEEIMTAWLHPELVEVKE